MSSVLLQAFINPELLQVITAKLTFLLELSWDVRDEETNTLIERILVLIRNILHVPTTDEDQMVIKLFIHE